MKIIVSNQHRASDNLALEQTLLASEEDIILLYVNRAAVVVGRNQTIEAEVDCNYCREHDIEVVRRQTGGGAVYHDCGNLNYAIICNSPERPLDKDYTEPIVWALRRLGVDAVTGSRGEITVGGVKVSGSASMVHRGRVLFHGTLLFDVNLQTLEAALRGDESLRGRGIKSVRSRTGNLKPMLGSVDDMESFIARMETLLRAFYNI